jgi:LysR family transcriptional regulator, glycine cleavage system transcriptional activator
LKHKRLTADNRLPPLQALRAFDAVMHHMSFVKAATALSVTPSAISHQIKLLEEWLGVKLFRRLNRGIELTREGRNLAPDVRDAFSRLALGVTRIREDSISGVLRVSASPSLASKWLVPRLDGFMRRHPEIDIRVSASPALVDFDRDGVDVALRYGTGRYPGCTVDLLFAADLFPVCSPNLLKFGPRLREPRDLRLHVLVHDMNSDIEGRMPGWHSWLSAAGVKDFDVSSGPRFNNSYLAIDAAVAGNGVALGSAALAAGDLAAGRLVRPFGISVKGSMGYYAVAPKLGAKRPKVNEFRRWLIDEARGTRAIKALRPVQPASGHVSP